MINGADHNLSKYQSKHEETIKNSEQKFKKKFKLTQKIQQLSSPIYQRTFSPWTRRRQQSLIKPTHIAEQNGSFVNLQHQAPVQAVRQQTNINHETNIGDFLRKIQFTKRKQTAKNSIFSPDKKESGSLIQKYEDKKLIIYPKQASPVKYVNNTGLLNDSTVNKDKKKSSHTLIATITNFYDPFQHKSKEHTIYSLPKGMVNLKLKIKEDMPLNKTESMTKPHGQSQMQKTFRKNSVDDRTNGQNFISNQTDRNMSIQDDKSKIVINSTQRKFFKTHKKAFSRRSITEYIQGNLLELNQNLSHHQRNKSNDSPIAVGLQLSYASPGGQAIKRIKMQHKRSRKVKTEVNQLVNGHNRKYSQDNSMRKDDKEYLYKTFLNYKTQKNSNDHNIIKTLNLSFHNKESFKINLQKIIQFKPK